MPHAELQTKPKGPEAAAKRPEEKRSPSQRDPGQPGFAAPGSRLAGPPGDILLKLQRSHGNRYVQRFLQRSGMGLGGGPVSSETEGAIERARGTGRALDSTTRSSLEESMGADFGNVRVHTGPQAEALNQSLSARAFTTGSDVFFARGEYQPGSSAGRELLAHELTHVVQQGAASEVRRKCAECEEEERKAGAAGGAPALQAKLVVGAADDPYEREADEVARQVMRAPAVQSPAVQRKCARCQAEEEQAARRVVRRDASPAVRRAPRLNTVTQPPSAALSVAMEGFFFEPSEAAVYEAGPKAPQLLAMVLNRLVGSQYRPGLVDSVTAFLDSRKQQRHGGFLEGQTAKAGEPIGRTGLFLVTAVILVDYLEKQRKLKVDLSPEQRDLLEKGFATADAWSVLVREAQLQQNPLPLWYTIELFFQEMGQQGALLKTYQEALKLIPVNRAAAESVGRFAISQILASILAPIQVLDAIRLDTSLAGNDKTRDVYTLLWNVAKPGPDGAIAVPTQIGKPGAVAFFLAWARSQAKVAEEAETNPARRIQLLERYGRFLGQVTVKGPATGNQQIRDTPARANRPPFPSTLSAVPPLQPPLFDAALGTDHRFSLQVEFPDVFAALGSYGFAWERVRIPDDKIGKPVDPDKLEGEKATYGEVASVRFSRATRYAKADIERVVDETMTDLGPVGVGALELVGANAILRYIGTGIQFAVEVLTTPRHQKHIVFPEPGLYLVRGIMSPYLKGEEEVVRAPSVAYYPVLARDPDEMASAGVAGAAKSREAAKARVAEIDARLKEANLDAKERQALLAEREDLQRSFGPVGLALEHQRAELAKYVDEVKAGRQSGEIAGAEQQLEVLDKILKVRAKRGLANGESPVARFVSDLGQNLPLNLEVVDKPKAGKQFHVVVSDLTTPKSGLENGYGETRDKAILAALVKMLEGGSGYGRGRVSIQLGGVTHTRRIEASLGNLLMESIDNVALVLSIAAIAAAPFTAGASLALLIPVGIAGAVPSAYRVAERVEAGTFTLDLENAMELVNIVGSTIGLARLGAGSLRLVRVGRGLLILGYGADALGGILMGANLIDQINKLQALPEGERAAALTMLIGQTMLSVGITVGGSLAERAHQAHLEARLKTSPPEPVRHPPGAPELPAATGHGNPPGAGEAAKRPMIRDIEPLDPSSTPPRPPETGQPAEPSHPSPGPGEESEPVHDPSHPSQWPTQESEWILATNAAGAEVFKSLTPISVLPAHVEGIVVRARREGKKVTIITGYHGSSTGGTHPEKKFARDDAKFYGKRYPDVAVIDTSEMTHDQRMAVIDSTAGIVIVSTCYGACAKPSAPARPAGSKPLALPSGESKAPPLALPAAGETSGPPVRANVEEMFHKYDVQEDLQRLGPVNEETKPLLEKNDTLREALVESPLAAVVLKKCSSPCYPPNATQAEIQRLERYLRNVGPGYDEAALRKYLYDRRGELTAAISQLEQSKTPADLNAKLAFLNTKGEKGIEKLPAREDPRIRGELVERAHDIGVKYGESQAKADGLIDVGFDNPIQIGGFDQGFDDVMRQGPNLDTGDVYIVEYKGGSARLAPGQMEFDWVVGNIRRLYNEGGSAGQSWARALAKALREGRLKGVAYSTPLSGGSPLPTAKVGTWAYKPTRIAF
ncbi:MAG TPA: DUF4157 domain-containing protein [Thermoanaerobaculia bacterium]|nr:DUF4157 domain-containing protein [Thermoanaerobaculia bacterium]